MNPQKWFKIKLSYKKKYTFRILASLSTTYTQYTTAYKDSQYEFITILSRCELKKIMGTIPTPLILNLSASLFNGLRCRQGREDSRSSSRHPHTSFTFLCHFFQSINQRLRPCRSVISRWRWRLCHVSSDLRSVVWSSKRQWSMLQSLCMCGLFIWMIVFYRISILPLVLLTFAQAAVLQYPVLRWPSHEFHFPLNHFKVEALLWDGGHNVGVVALQ